MSKGLGILRGQLDFEQVSLDKGSTFADRYLIKAILGQGGMGMVYLAEDLSLDHLPVALKILHQELATDERQTSRFMREVTLTRQVTHPNVLRTYEFGSVNGRLFFTMEYAAGKTLEELITPEPLTSDQTLQVLLELCLGLQAIHEAGITHRDLKPGNVIITTQGTLKIGDFGVARPLQSKLTLHTEVVGSAHYMAPEVWLGKEVSSRTDIYSVGVLAYELLCGIPPFDGDSAAEIMCKHLELAPVPPLELDPNIPPELSRIINWCLAKEQQDRPASAHALHTMLAKIAAGTAANDWLDLVPAVDQNEFLSEAEDLSPTTHSESSPDEHTIHIKTLAGFGSQLSPPATLPFDRSVAEVEASSISPLHSPILRIFITLQAIAALLSGWMLLDQWLLVGAVKLLPEQLGLRLVLLSLALAPLYLIYSLPWLIPSAAVRALSDLPRLGWRLALTTLSVTVLMVVSKTILFVILADSPSTVINAANYLDLIRQSSSEAIHALLLLPMEALPQSYYRGELIGSINHSNLNIVSNLTFGCTLFCLTSAALLGALSSHCSEMGLKKKLLWSGLLAICISCVVLLQQALLSFITGPESDPAVLILQLPFNRIELSAAQLLLMTINWLVLCASALWLGSRHSIDGRYPLSETEDSA